MKILRLYTRLPPYSGGMENHIAQLSRQQINIGHDVVIYFNRGSKVSSKDVQITKFPLFKLKPQFFGLFFFHLLVFIRLLLNQEKFDVIHIHGDWSSLIFAKLIKKIAGSKKIIISIHDELSKNLFSVKALRFFLSQVDLIFASGYELEAQLKKLTRKKIIVQPSGINNIFFDSKSRAFNVKSVQLITVASLVKKKNLGLILDIAKKLKTLDFNIVGEGPQKKYLSKRIKDESIFNVKILGFKTPEQLHSLYYQNDIFLLTSEKEGTPTSMIEAMACGLPIVTSSAGGVKKILGQHNYVVNENNKKHYINCINKLLNNAESLEELSKHNISMSKVFSWSSIVKKIDNYFID